MLLQNLKRFTHFFKESEILFSVLINLSIVNDSAYLKTLQYMWETPMHRVF